MSEAFIYLLDWVSEGNTGKRATFVLVSLWIIGWSFAEFGCGIGKMFQRKIKR